jgi:hypothetical protein
MRPKTIRRSDAQDRSLSITSSARSHGLPAMMGILFISMAAILFYEAFARLGTLHDVKALNSTVADAFKVIRDPKASDLEKERVSRRSSVVVLRYLALTIAKITFAVTLSTLVLWALCAIAGTGFGEALALSADPVTIALLVLLMLAYGWLRHVRGR